MILRPPYGSVNDNVMTHIHTPVILWSVDTRDWAEKDVDSIFGHIQNDIFDGAIKYYSGEENETLTNIDLFMVDSTNVEDFWTFD